MLLLHVASQVAAALPALGVQHAAHALVPADGGNAFQELDTLAGAIKTFIIGLGVVAFFVGISVAAIMRMLAFGSERRVATSNMALSAAIVGIIIILLANAIFAALHGWLPNSDVPATPIPVAPTIPPSGP